MAIYSRPARYTVRVSICGQQVYIGDYETEFEAEAAHKRALAAKDEAKAAAVEIIRNAAKKKSRRRAPEPEPEPKKPWRPEPDKPLPVYELIEDEDETMVRTPTYEEFPLDHYESTYNEEDPEFLTWSSKLSGEPVFKSKY